MKLVNCPKPKGYIKLNIYFSNIDFARQHVNNLDNEFLLKKVKQLEYSNLSKRKRKLLIRSKPKKYLLTKEGSKFCLWRKY
jgi:hypothetical protein